MIDIDAGRPRPSRFRLAAAHMERWTRVIDVRLAEHIARHEGPGGILRGPLAHLVQAGGRRFRPLLSLATCELVGGDPRHALDVACAMEFIHTASLVLDDLPCMDDARTRRGVEAVHLRFGTATAILVSFALLNLAHELLASPAPDAGRMVPFERHRYVARAIGANGMIGGQEADLRLSARALPASAELREVRLLKTSALITAAAVAGAYTGGARAAEIARIEEFGAGLGRVFQRVDDNLDADEDAGSPGTQPTPSATLLEELHRALDPLRGGFPATTARGTVEELALAVIAGRL
jgi:geranylgeranyl diphosphate synthase, type II